MTDYTMPVLSEQERDRLTDYCKYRISELAEYSLQAKCLKIALAALTAKPVAYKDSLGCFVTPRKGELLIQAGEAAYPLFMAPHVPVKQEGE